MRRPQDPGPTGQTKQTRIGSSSGGPTCRPLFFMSWAVLRGRAGMHADGGPATFSFLTLRSMAGPRWPQGGEDLRIS